MIDHRFLREQTVSGDTADEIDDEIRERAESGMLNLCDVLKFIIDGLDNVPFTQQNPVIHRSETAVHVVFQLGYQLYAINEELVEKVLADIAFIAHKFTIDKLHDSSYFSEVRCHRHHPV